MFTSAQKLFSFQKRVRKSTSNSYIGQGKEMFLLLFPQIFDLAKQYPRHI